MCSRSVAGKYDRRKNILLAAKRKDAGMRFLTLPMQFTCLRPPFNEQFVARGFVRKHRRSRCIDRKNNGTFTGTL